MPRPKTSSTIFIESFLQKHGVDTTYDDLFNSDDYRAFVSQEKNLIDSGTFSAVKSRTKRLMDHGTQEQNVIQMPAKKFFVDPANFSYSKEVRDLIPEVDPNFIIDGLSEGFIGLVRMRSQMEGVNVRLVGPAGCGKTSFATHYAAVNNLPCLIMDCANVREPRDWFGYRTLDPVTKEIVWHESLFIKMIETPGTVIVLDELNRVSPLIVNTLIPLLDHRRATYLEEAGRTISCAEQVTFWAAINEGNQFTGTIALDEAVSDRFGLVMECNFLSQEDETKVLNMRSGLDIATCKKLVEVATQVRSKCQQHGVDTFSKPISTRMLVEAAKGMLLGGTSTFHYTLLNHFSSFGGSSSERQTLAKLLVGKFGSIYG
jgi:nitric oxide reductase NorQ protein